MFRTVIFNQKGYEPKDSSSFEIQDNPELDSVLKRLFEKGLVISQNDNMHTKSSKKVVEYEDIITADGELKRGKLKDVTYVSAVNPGVLEAWNNICEKIKGKNIKATFEGSQYALVVDNPADLTAVGKTLPFVRLVENAANYGFHV